MKQKLITTLATLTLLILLGSNAWASWHTFVIRNATSDNTAPVIQANNSYSTPAQEFIIDKAGKKAAWGTNELNGKKVKEIFKLFIKRYDDRNNYFIPPSTYSGGYYAPYLNIWITDGSGNYAVIANEPSNPEWNGVFNNGYDISWDVLKTKTCKVYETAGAGSNTSWVHTLVGKTSLTFEDVKDILIYAPTVTELTTGWTGLGTGAPRELGTNVAYGFNWVLGDTQANYLSIGVGYVLADPEVQSARVHNVTQDKYYYMIQAAIDAANPGDVIHVDDGTFVENVNITKSVVLRGANYGVSGCGTRGAESVIQGAFTIGTDGITVDGFEFTGANAQIASTSGATVRSNITIVNNYLHTTTAQIPIRHGLGLGGGIGSTNWNVSNNKIEDIQFNAATAIAVFNVTNATINNNCITHTNAGFTGRRGINADGLQNANISGNTINLGGVANNNVDAPWIIQISMSDRDANNITVDGNTISGAYYGITTLSQRNVTGLTVSNNVIGPVASGVTLNTGGTVPQISKPSQTDIIIEGNTISTVTPTISGALGAAVRLRNLHEIHANGPVGFNNVTVNNNSFLVQVADAAVINNNVNYNLDATCNWWGSALSCDIAPKVIGNVTFVPFLSDGTDGSGAIGFQPAGTCNGTGNLVYNVNTGKWFCSIQSAIDDATTLNGHTLQASTGTYTESPNVNKELTITAASTPVLLGMFTINANNVTISNFTINNPNGNYGILSKNVNHILIKNNKIHNIGTSVLSGATYGVYFPKTTVHTNDLIVEGNEVYNIRGGRNTTLSSATNPTAKNNNGSGCGVGFGDSESNYDQSDIIVRNNIIYDVEGYFGASFSEGGKGAYGIIINVGAKAAYTGKANNAQILNNIIYDLEGYWATGIGLEGETPYAKVMFNKVSDLIEHKSSFEAWTYDAQAVKLEQNDAWATVKINFNSFKNMKLGIMNSTSTSNIDGQFNWWDDCLGPKQNTFGTLPNTCTNGEVGSAGVGVGCYVDYAPWLGGSFTGLSSILHLNSAYFFVNGTASGTNVNSWPYDWCPGTNAAASPATERNPLYTIASPPMVNFGTTLALGGHGWGSSDVMQINSNSAITSTSTDVMAPTNGPKTLFIAFKPNDNDNNERQVLFEAGETTSGYNVYLDGQTLGFGMWNRLQRRFNIYTPVTVPNGYYLVQLEYNGSEFKAIVNGNASTPLSFSGLTQDPDDIYTTGSESPSVGIAGEVLGTRFHDYNIRTNNYAHTFNGGIGDVLLFNSVLTQAQIDEVYAYFNSKYGQNWGVPQGYAAKRGDWKVISEDESASMLAEAWPNPFTGLTNFTLELADEQTVTIELYNSMGELVETLFNGKLGKGPSTFTIDGTSLPNGMYIYKATGNGFVLSGKAILIK